MVPKGSGFNQSVAASGLCARKAWRFPGSTATVRDGKLLQMPHSCHHVETIRHPNTSYLRQAVLYNRCHRIIKIPEYAPEIFRTSCSRRSILVLHYTSQTHVFRNPRQYLVEQNQCNAKQVLARPALSLWCQHNFHVMEQWTTRRCSTTRHLTSNFRSRYTLIMWFLFSATSYDFACLTFYE